MCSVESLCGPGGGPGITQIFVWFLCFIPVSRERLGGSRICSELSALVRSAWWELAQSQGFWGREVEAQVLEGNPVGALGLGDFSARVLCFLGSG